MSATFVFVMFVRLFCAFMLTGYIHPDEYFQNPQVSAQLISWSSAAEQDPATGALRQLTWEWHLDQDASGPGSGVAVSPSGGQPCRSILGPLMSTVVPFWLMDHLLPSTCWLRFLVTRVPFLLLSFVLDWAAARLARRLGYDPWTVQWTLALSWPMLVLQVRPFSNGLEAVVLACFLVAVSRSHEPVAAGRLRQRSADMSQVMVVAILLALGTWIRFTFPLFALPGLVLFASGAGWGAGQWIRMLVALLAGFMVMAIALVVLDSYTLRYLHGETLFSRLRPLLVTPLNGLAYNANADNLARHGIHCHWTHALFNMPLLFGSLALTWWCNFSEDPLNRTLFFTVVGGLACLSAAPHQEARFLLPLLIPVTVLSAPLVASRRWLKWLFLIHSLALTVFFGGFHQAGVVPAQCRLADGGDVLGDTAVVFWNTYPPAPYLFPDPGWTVLELAGAPGNETCAVLNRLLASPAKSVFLVVPSTVQLASSLGSSVVMDNSRSAGMTTVQVFCTRRSAPGAPASARVTLREHDEVSQEPWWKNTFHPRWHWSAEHPPSAVTTDRRWRPPYIKILSVSLA